MPNYIYKLIFNGTWSNTSGGYSGSFTADYTDNKLYGSLTLTSPFGGGTFTTAMYGSDLSAYYSAGNPNEYYISLFDSSPTQSVTLEWRAENPTNFDFVQYFSPTYGSGPQLGSSYEDNGAITSVTPNAKIAPFDFNNDGTSDLLLQHTDGTIAIETQSNLAVTTDILIGNPGPAWHVIASADFDGDGHPDLLLQNNNGAVVNYLMNGTTITAGHVLGNAGPAWHVRGAADFNQDGRADVLLQNDNGQMVIWTTNGSSVTAGINAGNPGPGWTIEGVADFNADGQPDILLQNTNGDIVDYVMNGTAIQSGYDLGNPGAGWAIAGTGDYNGDGRADILLHNDNGADVIWDTNGTSVIAATFVGNPGPSYTGAVAGIDLNGDGSTDLLIQNTDSTLIGYTLNNTGAVTAGANLGNPGIGWHAIGSTPMEFIDGTLGQANLVATPGPDQFDFTSFTGGLQQITGFDPAQDSLALNAAAFANNAAVQAREYPYQGGTLIELAPNAYTAAVLIQGVTPDHLSAANFVFR